MDWGTRHLIIILGTGGGTFANRRADHLTIFSNARGLSEGEEGGRGGGGMLSRSGPGCSKRGQIYPWDKSCYHPGPGCSKRG